MTAEPSKTAIITGGAKRIGGAMARALAADGWHVLIHCNASRAEADALAAELVHASVVAADLADLGAADTFMAACADLPPARLLINSASRFVYDRIEDFAAADFDTHMAVNLRAPALLTRAFAAALPEMLPEIQPEAALVINLLDAKLASLNPD